jgi:hypothetical protein
MQGAFSALAGVVVGFAASKGVVDVRRCDYQAYFPSYFQACSQVYYPHHPVSTLSGFVWDSAVSIPSFDV